MQMNSLSEMSEMFYVIWQVSVWILLSYQRLSLHVYSINSSLGISRCHVDGNLPNMIRERDVGKPNCSVSRARVALSPEEKRLRST